MNLRAVGAVVVLTSAASFIGGVVALIKYQCNVLPGRILVMETEEFLAEVMCEEDEDL